MKRTAKKVFVGVLCITLAIRFGWALVQDQHNPALSYIGHKVSLIGRIVQVTEYHRGTSMKVEVDDVGHVEVKDVALDDSLEPGDVVKISGVLEKKYGRIGGPFSMVRAHVSLVHYAEGFYFAKLLARLNGFLMERLDTALPEPIASLARGVVLGDRTNIPFDVVTDFRKAGVGHILALSGFNIVILIVCIEQTLAFMCGKKTRAFLAMAVILMFILLVGPSASVVRAGIMGSLSLIAGILGRPKSGLRLLVISMYLMLLHDPLVFFDIGFQLSCSATAGLMLFASRIENFLSWVPESLALRKNLASTLAAIGATLPLSIFYFNSVSLISPLANILVVPLVPFFMLAVLFAFTGIKLLAAPAWILGKIMYFIIHVCASVPFGFVEM